MSTASDEPTRSHPLAWFTGRLHEVLDELGEPSTWTMSNAELAMVAAELTTGIARLQGHLMAVLAEADRSDIATCSGAVNAAGWLRGLTPVTGPEATRLVRTARALQDHAPIRQALARGRVRLDQAEVIAEAVDAVPVEHRDAGERHLLAEAAAHDAKALRVLGRHLLEVVAPDIAEEHLARQLQRQETAAARKTRFSMRDNRDGTYQGTFRIPVLHGAILNTALDAIANPARRPGLDQLTRGEAFTEYLQRFPTDKLPHTGGVNATIVVTIPLETIQGRLNAGRVLGTDIELSPGAALRLACQAGIMPAILDSHGHVLHLGRTKRLFTPAQRIALTIEQDGLCAAEHCDRPATWSDAHHPTPWSAGGHTSTHNGALLCPRHHTLAHDDRLTTTRLGTGKLRFSRRT